MCVAGCVSVYRTTLLDVPVAVDASCLLPGHWSARTYGRFRQELARTYGHVGIVPTWQEAQQAESASH